MSELDEKVTIDETPDPNDEIDPLKILGIPTERKPEHFEPEAEINEDLPDFDPPEPKIELPELSAKKTTSKSVINSGSESMASVIIEGVDVAVPIAIDHFIAKEGNPEQFSCQSSELKGKAKQALAKYLGDMNIEVSPLWEMVFAVGLMYLDPIMNAIQVAKLKRENQEQKEQLDESEKLRIEEKKKRIELEKRLNETDFENAKIAEKAAEAKLKAKQLDEELKKLEKPKTPRRPTASRKPKNPKNKDGKN